jgi:hypothetical protein
VGQGVTIVDALVVGKNSAVVPAVSRDPSRRGGSC